MIVSTTTTTTSRRHKIEGKEGGIPAYFMQSFRA